MKIIDNINRTVYDDLKENINRDSKISITAACFFYVHIWRTEKQWKDIKQFRFIFTLSIFAKEKTGKQKREFYIPRLMRKSSTYRCLK